MKFHLFSLLVVVSLINSARANTCPSSPCKNGGTCYLVEGQLICICPYPWDGDRCDKNIGGSILLTTTGMTTTTTTTTPRTTTTITTKMTTRTTTAARLTPGSGTCVNAPCKNGGTCVPMGASYSCFCGISSSYTGQNCDSTTPMSQNECPLECAPGKCIFSGFAERPYACLWNGIMRPKDGTTA